MTRQTDPALWAVRPRFGVAGGPDEIVLTDEGLARAFSVGAQVRRGPAADALKALWVAGGHGYLEAWSGSTLWPTDLGRFDQEAWGRLRELGYVESIAPEPPKTGVGVFLTQRGKDAAWNGIQEQNRLLERCKAAANGG